MFVLNCKNARLHNFIPKHGKAEDAPRGCELQIRNAAILPSAVAAVLLAESGGTEVEAALLSGPDHIQRFWGIDSIVSSAEFANRHQAKIDHLDKIRVVKVDKIRIRVEGGPQRLFWVEFSIHIEDPTGDQVDHFHEQINRDISIALTQDADLVDEMVAKAKGMAVSTIHNGELDLDAKAERDADQLQQAADGLSGSAEIPLKTKRGQRKPAAKKSPKAKKKAA